MSLFRALDGVLGAPYRDPCRPPNSFNCTELVRYLRKYAGLETPLCEPAGPWLDMSPHTQLRNIQKTKRIYPWERVSDPQRCDLVMCSATSGAPAYHVGLWLDHAVVHAYASIFTGQGSVVMTSHSVFAVLYPYVEYWRLKA